MPATQTVVSDKAIYDARPVIEVDGQRTALLQQLLISMQVDEQSDGLAACELRFRNTAPVEDRGPDFVFEHQDNDDLALGKPIKVFSGDRADPQEIFSGTITGLEMVIEPKTQPELVVLAEDDLHRARMHRRTRRFVDASVADVVEGIAQELSLTPSISGLDAQHGELVQHNETDLAFLRRLLARFDADMMVTDGALKIAPRAEFRHNEVTLRIRSQLLAFRATADLAHQVSAVSFAGWDPAQGSAIHITSDGSSDMGPGRGRTGTEILEAELASRTEHLDGIAAIDQTEAQTLVNAAFAQRARKFVCADAIAVGNPAIRVGTHAELLGVGPRFENIYYVIATCHRYDRAGGQYVTEFKAECGFLGDD